jgi:hypothetical protein
MPVVPPAPPKALPTETPPTAPAVEPNWKAERLPEAPVKPAVTDPQLPPERVRDPLPPPEKGGIPTPIPERAPEADRQPKAPIEQVGAWGIAPGQVPGAPAAKPPEPAKGTDAEDTNAEPGRTTPASHPEPPPPPETNEAPAKHTTANDLFQVLTGEVYQWRKTWRLRYAPVDTDDPHGGSVTLVGSAGLDRLREGQRIRARGVLIAPPDRPGTPVFQVHSLESSED